MFFRFPRFQTGSSNSKSLPQRWKRGRQFAALSVLAFLTLFAGVLHPHCAADNLDSWWLRARFSLREWLSGQSKQIRRDPRIAIIEIDAKSSKFYKNEPEIAWGKPMAAVINQLNRSGARLIALDWTQPVETDARFGWNHDQLLGAALSQAKQVVFVKFIDEGGYILPANSLLYALPDAYKDGGESNLGFAELVSPNNVQASMFRQIPVAAGEKPEVSFAARIAEKSGFALPQKLPVRQDGSLLVNFADHAGARGARSPFERASFSDVARATSPDPRWKDKIVFIGTTLKGDNDAHAVPFLRGLTGARQIAGVELQAHATATLLDGDAIREPRGFVVWLLSCLVGLVGVAAYALWNWARAALVVRFLAVFWTALSFVLFATQNYALPLVLPLSSLLLGSFLMGGYRALSEERERGQVMRIWGRYQDPRLIEELLEKPDLRSGEGREVTATVLFADLKNFTQTVESLPAAQALEALNRYLSLLSATIREHGGYLDKYLGDGLMAEWGAPIPNDDHAGAAVRACLDIEKRIAALTAQVRESGGVWFEVRLTLHTGSVVAGPLGSDERLEYTIIGDTVNVTARLQETAKALNCDFLISETTCAALKGAVRTGQETEVAIRGRQAPLRVFEVLDDAIHPSSPT